MRMGADVTESEVCLACKHIAAAPPRCKSTSRSIKAPVHSPLKIAQAKAEESCKLFSLPTLPKSKHGWLLTFGVDGLGICRVDKGVTLSVPHPLVLKVDICLQEEAGLISQRSCSKRPDRGGGLFLWAASSNPAYRRHHTELSSS